MAVGIGHTYIYAYGGNSLNHVWSNLTQFYAQFNLYGFATIKGSERENTQRERETWSEGDCVGKEGEKERKRRRMKENEGKKWSWAGIQKIKTLSWLVANDRIFTNLACFDVESLQVNFACFVIVNKLKSFGRCLGVNITGLSSSKLTSMIGFATGWRQGHCFSSIYF